MDINVLIIISCICMLFVLGRIFIVPVKWILKLAFNSVIGGVLIWVINLIGGVWGFHIGLNIYTSLLVRIARSSRGNCFDIIEVNSGIKINFSYNIKNRLHNFYGACFGWLEHISVAITHQINGVQCDVGNQYQNIVFGFRNSVQNFVDDFAGILERVTEQFGPVDGVTSRLNVGRCYDKPIVSIIVVNYDIDCCLELRMFVHINSVSHKMFHPFKNFLN